MSKRITFDFPTKAEERLNSLKAETEAVSYAEVMKTSLRVYATIIGVLREGKSFLVQDKDGSVTPFNPLYTGGPDV